MTFTFLQVFNWTYRVTSWASACCLLRWSKTLCHVRTHYFYWYTYLTNYLLPFQHINLHITVAGYLIKLIKLPNHIKFVSIAVGASQTISQTIAQTMKRRTLNTAIHYVVAIYKQHIIYDTDLLPLQGLSWQTHVVSSQHTRFTP